MSAIGGVATLAEAAPFFIDGKTIIIKTFPRMFVLTDKRRLHKSSVVGLIKNILDKVDIMHS